MVQKIKQFRRVFLIGILFLFATASNAQDSWINIQLLTDDYPVETSLQIVQQSDSSVIFQNDPNLQPNTLYSDTLLLHGNSVLSIFDSYGDGLGASQWGGTDGWLLIQNDCQDTIMYVSADFGFSLIDTLDIAPCAPPIENVIIIGCMDNNYDNFNPDATINDDTLCGNLIILGCTNPDAPNFNPWATLEDNSCVGIGCTDGTSKMILLVTLDQYPSETSWILTDISNSEVIYAVSAQSYTFNQSNTTISYDICVPVTGVELVLSDSYGDGLAGSLYNNGADGNFEILGDTDPCGGGMDLIWTLDSANFGLDAQTGIIYLPSCAIPLLEGCTDSEYVEYDPLVDIMLYGSCQTLKQYGCTDISAFNYDETANTNEIVSICEYTLTIEDDASDGWGESYLAISQGNLSEIYTLGPGISTQSYQLELDAGKPIYVYYFEVKGEQQPIAEVEFQTMHNSFTIFSDDGTLISGGTNPFANNGLGALQSFQAPLWDKYIGIPQCGDLCESVIFGCTDQFNWLGQEMFNYNPNANTYDPEIIPCVAIKYGCTDPSMFGYYAAEPANTDDGSCMPWFIGCMESEAWNYNVLANINDNESCVYFGCIDDLALNYDETANTENGSCIYPTLGCMNPFAFNFNIDANVDDESCIPKIYGCTDPSSWNYDEDANTSIDNCIPFVYGCTDATALNYNPMANTNNESCVPIILGCMDITALNYDITATLEDGTCIEILFGCTDQSAFNYNEFANLDNESCIPFIFGCTDPAALNYDVDANTENFNCITPIYGCMDPYALNFDSLANVDTDACIPTEEGCMDTNAFNYNENYNTDDGSCLYDAGCIDGPGNPYWLNDPCYAWVIAVDEYCCTNAWDSYCQSQHDYCTLGWPVDVDELISRDSSILIYPNPTNGYLYITTTLDLDLDIKVYTMIGTLVSEGKTDIDMTKYPTGIYNVQIRYNDTITNRKVLKY